MKGRMKNWLRPALFTLGGGLAGFAYYTWVGCTAGSCAITSSPFSSVIYMALIGWLLSSVFGSGNCQKNSKP